MRISDYLDVPTRPDLNKFIVGLDDDDADTLRRNIRQFIVTDKLLASVDAMLGSAGERLGQNKDIGRFVYGSFGSGKSHLMTILGRMLVRDEAVYDFGHKHLRVLRGKHPWLDERRCLVVRLNMMGKTSLIHALYDAYNGALPSSAARLDFTDEEQVFDLFERDAARLGGLEEALRSVAEDGALDGIEGFPAGLPAEALVELYGSWRHETDRNKRLSLAAALETWRNHGRTRVRPDDLWVDPPGGFDRMARHARDQGFHTIVWLIDELVIWLRGTQRDAYVSQINTLSAMVDHDSPRVLPFLVLVAVQTDIAETCPSDLSEQGFREQLSFISNRFQPAVHLEEQDLFEVCAQRVLARKEDLSSAQKSTFEAAIDGALRQNERLVRELAGGIDPAKIRALYPFHPSTLRVLIDVTQALSRNRTAIAALYGLLDAHRALEVGRFLPLASLWEILFTPDNVRAMANHVQSPMAQSLNRAAVTWERLAGKVAAITRDDGVADTESESKAQTELRKTVQTALLCQLSERPYFPDGRALREAVTTGTLYAFSQSEVSALTEATGRAKVIRQLRKLSGVAPEVTVTDGEDPRVDIRTRNLDVDRKLAEARGKVQHHHRFAYMRGLMRDVLGLPIGDKTEGKLKLTWRGTDRVGKVVVANVRTASYAGAANSFDPGDAEFLVVVDYPFDEDAGCTRQHDIDTATRAKMHRSQWTLCWLPDHLTPTEMTALDNAAAVELIRQDRRTWLAEFSPNDAKELAAALEAFQASRRAELEQAVSRCFFERQEVFGMKASLENVALLGGDRTKALDALGKQVLDARYPRHPVLGRRVGAAELVEMADWVLRAAATNQPTEPGRGQSGLVEALAVPLQLVFPGQGRITARRDGEYLAKVLAWAGERTAFDAVELRNLLGAEDGWQFGFNRDFQDFFLFWLLQVEGFEAQEGGRSVTVQGMRNLNERFRLVKDEVVDAPTWDKARSVASDLLDIKGRADLPSSPEQAKLARDVQKAANGAWVDADRFLTALDAVLGWSGVLPTESMRRGTASALKAAMQALGAEATNAGVARRLASFRNEAEYLPSMRLRRELANEGVALERIASAKLAVTTVAEHGTDVEKQEVVARLRALLIDGVPTSLLRDRAETWARRTNEVFTAVLKRLAPPVNPPPPVSPPPINPPPPKPGSRTVDLPATRADAALAAISQQVKDALATFGTGKVRVHVVVEPAGDDK